MMTMVSVVVVSAAKAPQAWQLMEAKLVLNG
jgi:hypothetical protein